VFRTRKAVCAGYAQLLTALGKAAGADIHYVVGDARTEGSDETGEGHAWNAARINGRYYLIDATWDSGSVHGTTFTKRYRTEYLFTPPEIIGQTHFPEQAKWQLRDPAISRGEFFRQAMMQPSFYAEQRALISPTRSQVTVHGALDVTMKNPGGLFTLADFGPVGFTGSDGTNCEVKGRDDLRVHCAFPGAGRYTVRLFSNTEQAGTYHFIGQVDANDEH
jgi:transglutaminase/protease-like cytokinesis protein 3